VNEISAECYGVVKSIGVGEGAAWLVTEEGGDRTLMRFNAESEALEAKIGLPSSSAGVVVDYGSVWVTSNEKSERVYARGRHRAKNRW
jgi:hypothetical protein